ncbi:hypothetical protein BU14_2137s0001 [Porphyra umbilicalis]|uniref:Uncharacterized protein n=1 Tax=Porphyra umbilicalis TaxID=2786 RepID=A0A1X6NK76_PORUM|nr:hypothetical protein BU14_2137s0001 [Porphyra umbilicalis]|eukprot:OSX68876.1 hypothetical protein BU14_2137s0001 [Porphyra umbilicalis]
MPPLAPTPAPPSPAPSRPTRRSSRPRRRTRPPPASARSTPSTGTSSTRTPPFRRPSSGHPSGPTWGWSARSSAPPSATRCASRSATAPPTQRRCTRTGCGTPRTRRARRTQTERLVLTRPTTGWRRVARTCTRGRCPPARAPLRGRAPRRGCTTRTTTRLPTRTGASLGCCSWSATRLGRGTTPTRPSLPAVSRRWCSFLASWTRMRVCTRQPTWRAPCGRRWTARPSQTQPPWRRRRRSCSTMTTFGKATSCTASMASSIATRRC